MSEQSINDCARCLTSEQQEMEKYRWVMSKSRGYDVGKDAYIEWINKYARIWRILDNYEKKYNLCRCELENEINNVTTGMNEKEKLEWLQIKLEDWLNQRTQKNS